MAIILSRPYVLFLVSFVYIDLLRRFLSLLLFLDHASTLPVEDQTN